MMIDTAARQVVFDRVYNPLSARTLSEPSQAAYGQKAQSFSEGMVRYAANITTAATLFFAPVTAKAAPPEMSAYISTALKVPLRRVSASVHQDARQAMQSYLGLTDGWDGDGSIKPAGETISNALRFLETISPKSKSPEALVTSDGCVSWFWDTQSAYIDVTFYPTGNAAFVVETQDGGTFSGKFNGTDGGPVPLSAAIFNA